MFSFVIVIISFAISTSRIRDSAAVRFSEEVFKLLIVCSRRFWYAPSLERSDETFESASSITVIATLALTLVPYLYIIIQLMQCTHVAQQ